jgi:hypothetical protein
MEEGTAFRKWPLRVKESGRKEFFIAHAAKKTSRSAGRVLAVFRSAMTAWRKTYGA